MFPIYQKPALAKINHKRLLNKAIADVKSTSVECQTLRVAPGGRIQDPKFPIDACVNTLHREIFLYVPQEGWDEEVLCALLHEWGHIRHLQILGFERYARFPVMDKEFWAWDLGWEEFPSNVRPRKKTFCAVMNYGLDTYERHHRKYIDKLLGY